MGVKGHRKGFPKLVKMWVLYISEIYFNYFPRNKASVVLKLSLLTSHMDKYATALIESLRNTSECDVMFDKYRRQTLTVALFNLCYVFYFVFVKRIKWCIVRFTIVQMGLPVDGVCIHSPKTRLVHFYNCAIECSGSQLATVSSAWATLRNGCSLFRRLWHDQLDMKWRVSGSQKMPFQPYSTNWVMQTIGHSPVHAFVNK